jgi:hypothetical protein
MLLTGIKFMLNFASRPLNCNTRETFSSETSAYFYRTARRYIPDVKTIPLRYMLG